VAKTGFVGGSERFLERKWVREGRPRGPLPLQLYSASRAGLDEDLLYAGASSTSDPEFTCDEVVSSRGPALRTKLRLPRTKSLS